VIVILLLSLLFISFSIHIYYLIRYVRTHNESCLWGFIDTTVINVFLAGVSILILVFKPEKIKTMDTALLMWFISGLMMTLVLIFQLSIFSRVLRRSKLPEYYHYNFFGKKILNPSVVKPMEVALFIVSMPFFLVSGAYFVARFIKLFL
jgi:hypothetical protein